MNQTIDAMKQVQPLVHKHILEATVKEAMVFYDGKRRTVDLPCSIGGGEIPACTSSMASCLMYRSSSISSAMKTNKDIITYI